MSGNMTSEKGVGDEWEFAGYVPGTSIPVYVRDNQKDTVLVSSGEIQDAFNRLEENLRRQKDQDAAAVLAFYNDGGSAADSNTAIAFLDPGFVMPQNAIVDVTDWNRLPTAIRYGLYHVHENGKCLRNRLGPKCGG